MGLMVGGDSGPNGVVFGNEPFPKSKSENERYRDKSCHPRPGLPTTIGPTCWTVRRWLAGLARLCVLCCCWKEKSHAEPNYVAGGNSPRPPMISFCVCVCCLLFVFAYTCLYNFVFAFWIIYSSGSVGGQKWFSLRFSCVGPSSRVRWLRRVSLAHFSASFTLVIKSRGRPNLTGCRHSLITRLTTIAGVVQTNTFLSSFPDCSLHPVRQGIRLSPFGHLAIFSTAC